MKGCYRKGCRNKKAKSPKMLVDVKGELEAAIPAPGRVFDRAALPAPELSDTSEQTPAAVQRTPSAEILHDQIRRFRHENATKSPIQLPRTSVLVAYLDIISHEAVGVYNMQVDECVFEETMAVQAMITSHAVGDDNSAAGRTHMLEIQHLNELDDDVLFTASDSLSEPTRWLMDEE